MKMILAAASAASLMLLTACGGDGDDALGDKAEEQAEMKADNMEAQGEAMGGAAGEQMQQQAEAIEEKGDQREEAIDNSDVDTDELSEQQKNAMVNGK